MTMARALIALLALVAQPTPTPPRQDGPPSAAASAPSSDLVLSRIEWLDSHKGDWSRVGFRMKNFSDKPLYFRARHDQLERTDPWVEWEELIDGEWKPTGFGYTQIENGRSTTMARRGSVAACELPAGSAVYFEVKLHKSRFLKASQVRLRIGFAEYPSVHREFERYARTDAITWEMP